jgi:predicted membrane chloride channel (bestrophin family)
VNQTRLASLAEAVINTAIGFAVSMVLSSVVYPLFGFPVTLVQNLGITTIFTIASVARSYAVRRWFNARIKSIIQRGIQ